MLCNKENKDTVRKILRLYPKIRNNSMEEFIKVYLFVNIINVSAILNYDDFDEEDESWSDRSTESSIGSDMYNKIPDQWSVDESSSDEDEFICKLYHTESLSRHLEFKESIQFALKPSLKRSIYTRMQDNMWAYLLPSEYRNTTKLCNIKHGAIYLQKYDLKKEVCLPSKVLADWYVTVLQYFAILFKCKITFLLVPIGSEYLVRDVQVS